MLFKSFSLVPVLLQNCDVAFPATVLVLTETLSKLCCSFMIAFQWQCMRTLSKHWNFWHQEWHLETVQISALIRKMQWSNDLKTVELEHRSCNWNINKMCICIKCYNVWPKCMCVCCVVDMCSVLRFALHSLKYTTEDDISTGLNKDFRIILIIDQEMPVSVSHSTNLVKTEIFQQILDGCHVKYCTDIHGAQGMNPSEFGDFPPLFLGHHPEVEESQRVQRGWSSKNVRVSQFLFCPILWYITNHLQNQWHS